MGVFTTGIFNAPRYSSFPWSHNNKISMNAGKIVPIAWDFLNTGDKFEGDCSNVVRLAPMLAPTLDTYKVDVHAFALRLRSLGHVTKDPWSYEDFFNLNKNQDGSFELPSIGLTFLFSLNGFRTGTLFEALGFPTFKKEREDYLSFLREKFPFVFDPIGVVAYLPAATGSETLTFAQGGFFPSSIPFGFTSEGGTYSNMQDIDRSYFDKVYKAAFGEQTVVNTSDFAYYFFSVGSSNYEDLISDDAAIDIKVPFRGTLINFIYSKYPEVFSGVSDRSDVLSFGLGFKYNTAFVEDGALTYSHAYDVLAGKNLLDEVYNLYKVDSVTLMKEFEDWLLDGLLAMPVWDSDQIESYYDNYFGYNNNTYFGKLQYLLYTQFPDLLIEEELQNLGIYERMIPVYPFDSYYKIISDWYINTALFEPDRFFSQHSFEEAWRVLGKATDYSYDDFGALTVFRNKCKELNDLFNRYWRNDYFTSAFPDPQAGRAVGIPVNGTIVDLRNANAMQKLKERLLYAGSRFRDVLFAITGKKTSAAILEMSEVIGSWSNIINVDSVLQQSASENGSPQAGYAGTGLGYRAGGKDARYIAEEPTVIMFVASIVPEASYFQGLSKKFCRGNVYDYAIPQLANVGEQSIRVSELYVGRDMSEVYSPSGSFTDGVFGFTRRNGDWMWTPNEVHGDFRDSLDYWHNARIFGSVPQLSESFLQIQPKEDNLNRIFAVQSDSVNHFYCNFSFHGHIVRSLPKHVHYDL